MNHSLTDTTRHPNRICFAADVELLALDDEAFVYSAEMQALFSQNATATFIWRVCDTGRPLNEVIGRTAEEFHLSPADARNYVESAVEEWRRCGLLEGSPRSHADGAGEHLRESKVTDTRRLADAGETWQSRRYAVLDTTFIIACQTAAQAERVADVLGHLEVEPEPGEPGKPPTVRLDIRATGAAHDIYADGQLAQRCDDLAELAPMMNWLVFGLAARNDAFLLQFHAAALGHDGRALLLPGPPGSGKSTLAAALSHRGGLAYMSDDSVVVERDGLGVRGLPFAVCVKEGGVAALAAQYPELGATREHNRRDGRRVRYMWPENLATAPHSAAWMVFLSFAPRRAENRVTPMPPAEGLRRILALAAPPRRLARDEAVALIGWARGIRSCELCFSDTDAAVATILKFRDG